jgi:hypothetical protein
MPANNLLLVFGGLELKGQPPFSPVDRRCPADLAALWEQ